MITFSELFSSETSSNEKRRRTRDKAKLKGKRMHIIALTCNVWLRQNDYVQKGRQTVTGQLIYFSLRPWPCTPVTTAADALWSCRYLTQLTDLTYHAISPLLLESIHPRASKQNRQEKRRKSHLRGPFNKTGVLITHFVRSEDPRGADGGRHLDFEMRACY